MTEKKNSCSASHILVIIGRRYPADIQTYRRPCDRASIWSAGNLVGNRGRRDQVTCLATMPCSLTRTIVDTHHPATELHRDTTLLRLIDFPDSVRDTTSNKVYAQSFLAFFLSRPKANANAQPTSGTTAMTRSARPTPCKWKPLPSPVPVRHSPNFPSIHRPEICPSLSLAVSESPAGGRTHSRDSRPGLPLPIWPIAMNLLPFPPTPHRTHPRPSPQRNDDEQSCVRYTSPLPWLDGIQSLRFQLCGRRRSPRPFFLVPAIDHDTHEHFPKIDH